MEIGFIITIFLIGFVGSYISGMLGIGGSIIKYPMLLYIPPLLGFAAFSAHEVAGISAIQVFFATIGGVWAYRKGGYLNKSLIVSMGGAILIGSFLGAYGSNVLPENTINLVYGILALTAAVMMFVPKKGLDDIPLDQVRFFARDYVHFVDRRNGRKDYDRPGRLGTGNHHGRRQSDCGTAWRNRREKNEYKDFANHFGGLDFSDSD